MKGTTASLHDVSPDDDVADPSLDPAAWDRAVRQPPPILTDTGWAKLERSTSSTCNRPLVALAAGGTAPEPLIANSLWADGGPTIALRSGSCFPDAARHLWTVTSHDRGRATVLLSSADVRPRPPSETTDDQPSAARAWALSNGTWLVAIGTSGAEGLAWDAFITAGNGTARALAVTCPAGDTYDVSFPPAVVDDRVFWPMACRQMLDVVEYERTGGELARSTVLSDVTFGSEVVGTPKGLLVLGVGSSLISQLCYVPLDATRTCVTYPIESVQRFATDRQGLGL